MDLKKLDKLLKFLKLLMENEFTGDIKIRLHKGNISNKMNTSFTHDIENSMVAFIEARKGSC